MSPTETPLLHVEVGGERHLLSVSSHEGAGTTFQFALPPPTPPGSLDATVHLAGEAYPALIEVQELKAVLVEPKTLEFRGARGSGAVATMQITSMGNVAIPLEPEKTLSLRKSGALARGVQKAFRDTHGDLISRLIVLGDHLSTEAAEEVTATCTAEFSALEVGESHPVKVGLRVPDELDPSTTWKGTLPLLGTLIDVRLAITADPQRRPAAKRRARKGMTP